MSQVVCALLCIVLLELSLRLKSLARFWDKGRLLFSSQEGIEEQPPHQPVDRSAQRQRPCLCLPLTEESHTLRDVTSSLFNE